MSEGIVISSSMIGKYKTAFEMTSIFFLILNGEYFTLDFHLVGMALLWVALALAVVSGFDYFRKFLKTIVT